MKFLYLHGFASSPTSTKANFFRNQLHSLKQDVDVLDLNGEDFATLKLSSVIKNIQLQYSDIEQIILIGSSMGGLVALNLAEAMPNIGKIILLAPALKINSLWQHIVGDVGMQLWRDKGWLPIYHYGKKQEINLHYDFIRDLQNVKDRNFTRQIPTLIFHGMNDATIPYNVSQEYAHTNPACVLNLLESDHSLEDSLAGIWESTIKFLESEL